ncbi:MAG: serine hydrolase [Pseudomonadota bacterium]
MLGKALKYGAGLLIVLVVVAMGYLVIAPPDLLRVATNYSAKIVCSNVFIAGRDANDVLTVDVQAPGHPLLKYITIDVDLEAETVSANLFNFVAPALAQHRAGLGCTNLHQSELSNTTLSPTDTQVSENTLWPAGSAVNLSQDKTLQDVTTDKDLLGEGFRALVVVKEGRMITEHYAEGFDKNTPLLGWSMTKTVTAGIIGTLVKSGKMDLKDGLTVSYPAWDLDERKEITVESMLGMSSGLSWNEAYGDVSDVTRMLFLNDDMAGFASDFVAVSDPGATFVYSSGTSTMLARAWQDRLGDDSLQYPQESLFKPLGMTSAVMETDANDTFVGSSYMYATARDWARFGQFLLQKGVWEGQQLLPVGYTDWMFEPLASSPDQYTKGHMWRRAPGGQPAFEDIVWMSGHDGQSIAVIPSRNMVIVRLGLTPSKLGYSSLPLAKAVIAAANP